MSLEEQLVDAVEENNIGEVRSLLEKGADPNIGIINCIGDKKTILYIAAEQDNIDIMKLLLRHGVDINLGNDRQGESKRTPLNAAIEKEQEEAAIFLVKNGADIHVRYHYGSTFLHGAIHKKLEKLIPLLLSMGANVHAKDTCRYTPLHEAARFDIEPQVVRLLLEYKSNVNAIDSSDTTPLGYYLILKNPKTLEAFFLLLLSGTNINKKRQFLRKEINKIPRFQKCLTAFEEIKAMLHLGRLIEAYIKRYKEENVKAIVSYINNEVERQELIEEFEVIKEKYGSNGELSFIPECLLYMIKNMIFTFLKFYDREKSIIIDFGNAINADTVTKEGTNVQRYLPEEVLKEIFSYLDSNEQKNVMLALSKKADVLLSKLQDTCQTPDTLLAKAYIFLGKLKNIYQTSTDKGCCIS